MARLYIKSIVSDGKETKERSAEEQLEIQVTYGSSKEPKELPSIQVTYWKNQEPRIYIGGKLVYPRIYIGGKLVHGVEES